MPGEVVGNNQNQGLNQLVRNKHNNLKSNVNIIEEILQNILYWDW